jgi:hypothetical protein
MKFIACDAVSVNEIDTQFNVYTILSNRLFFNAVKVERTYGIDEIADLSVDDAFVTLSSENIIDTLYSYEDWFYTTMTLQPSKTYRLEVSKDDIDTLIGITTLPDAFEFINIPFDTITLEDTVVFTRSKGAVFYYCLFDRAGRRDALWLKPDTLDSLIKIRVGDHIGRPPEGLCEITVIAFDQNYYKFTFEPDDSLRQTGVTGGLGLCGSAWQEQLTLFLDLPE